MDVQYTTDHKTYPVSEIYQSIQGEGSLVGTYCNFIRFNGCNLVCEYCDTKGKVLYTKKTLEKIIEQLTPGLPVILTGGEPMLFVDKELAYALQAAGHKIIIQTNGTQKVKPGTFYDKSGVYICVDVKCDETTFITAYLRADNNTVGFKREFKIPVYNTQTARAIDNILDDIRPNETIFISPIVTDGVNVRNFYREFASMNFKNVRLNMQVHKLIGVD